MGGTDGARALRQGCASGLEGVRRPPGTGERKGRDLGDLTDEGERSHERDKQSLFSLRLLLLLLPPNPLLYLSNVTRTSVLGAVPGTR